MRVQVALNIKVVESMVYEFSTPLTPANPVTDQNDTARTLAPDTVVLPMGSSTVAPGFSVAVG
jgi:hypothetical protein